MAIEFDPTQKFDKVVETGPTFDPTQSFDKVDQTTASHPAMGPYQKIQDAVAQASRHIPILGTAMNPAVQDAAMRGLDYLGGGIRTALASVGGVASKDDMLAALKGKAPRSAEYLAKAGVPEGPGAYGLNTRGAVGLAGDVLTDPLTYVNPIGALGEAGQAAKSAGTSMYKSGLKNLDIEGAKYGKEPVSNLLMKERVTGNAREIANQMDELAVRRKMERDAILQAADRTGAEVNVGQSLTHADAFLNNLKNRNNPDLEPLRSLMENRLEKIRKTEGHPAMPGQPEVMATSLEPQFLELPVSGSQVGLENKLPRPVNYEVGQVYPEVQIQKATPNIEGKAGPSPSQLSSWKTDSYNQIGDAAFDQAKRTPIYKQFEKELARGQRQEVERSVGEALGSDARQTLAQKNDELGRLLTTQERAARDAGIYERKNAATSVDGMLIGHALEAGHEGGLAPLVMKKLMDIGKESTFRTTGGLALQDLGATRIPDVLLRRAIIDQNNPWEMQK